MKFPSVTQVFRLSGLYDDMDLAGYANSQVGKHRGSALVKACHYLAYGQEPQWKGDDTHPELDRFLDGYRLFLSDHKWILEEHEKECISEVHRVVSHPDQIGSLDGQFSNVEIKTGALPDWVRIQLAGQNIALENRTIPRYSLHLPGNGRYKLHRWNDFHDYNEFLTLLHAVWVRSKYQGRNIWES